LCYAKKEELMGYMVEMQKAKDGTKETKRSEKSCTRCLTMQTVGIDGGVRGFRVVF
jgi:hypothetical protein